MAITDVSLTFRGDTYTLEYNAETGLYEADVTAPPLSSWREPSHVYPGGTVTVWNRDDLGTVNRATATGPPLRVLETVPPTIHVFTPEEYQVSVSETNTFKWYVRERESVIESGVDPETVSLKIDGVPQSGIVIVPAGHWYYYCEWTGEIPDGDHVVEFDVSDNDGNAAETVTLDYTVMLLITDRTAADVERAKYLNHVVTLGIATAEEYAELTETDLKGAYNAGDMNRVGAAVYKIHRWATRRGYSFSVSAKRDFIERVDGPTLPECEAYLADIAAIRSMIPVPDGTPNAPESMRFFGYEAANDIEKILCAAIRALTRDLSYDLPAASLSWFASGEIASGET